TMEMKKIAGFCALSILTGIACLSWVFLTLPDVTALVHTNPKTTALMEQRAVESKTKIQPLLSWVPYSRISIHLRNAVLVSEDSAFFHHNGFDWTQIKESLKRDWKDKRFARGASTIT